jgi:transcriptional regulator with XRE-family HTH domain
MDEDFRVLLRKLREEHDLTQTQVASLFRLDEKTGYQTILKWETGKGNPPAHKHRKTFIRYLGVYLGLWRHRRLFNEIWLEMQRVWRFRPVTDDEWKGMVAEAQIQNPLDQLRDPVGDFVGREKESKQLGNRE